MAYFVAANAYIGCSALKKQGMRELHEVAIGWQRKYRKAGMLMKKRVVVRRKHGVTLFAWGGELHWRWMHVCATNQLLIWARGLEERKNKGNQLLGLKSRSTLLTVIVQELHDQDQFKGNWTDECLIIVTGHDVYTYIHINVCIDQLLRNLIEIWDIIWYTSQVCRIM